MCDSGLATLPPEEFPTFFLHQQHGNQQKASESIRPSVEPAKVLDIHKTLGRKQTTLSLQRGNGRATGGREDEAAVAGGEGQPREEREKNSGGGDGGSGGISFPPTRQTARRTRGFSGDDSGPMGLENAGDGPVLRTVTFKVYYPWRKCKIQ